MSLPVTRSIGLKPACFSYTGRIQKLPAYPPKLLLNSNQSVENAVVAFVKGANERNEFFFKKNKQTVMYDEQVRTNKAKDNQYQGQTDFGMHSVR